MKGCRAHLCHLPGLGQVGHSLKGNQWKCWDPGLGPNVVGPPVLPPPIIWPTQSLTGWHFFTWLIGWPIAAGWLAISQNINLILPRQRHLVAKCVTPVVRLTCGQMYHPCRDILWTSVMLLQVRLTFGQTFGSGWPLVRCTPHGQRHLVTKCDTTSGQVDLFIWGLLLQQL